MPWDLSPFAETGLNDGLIEHLLGEHERAVRPGLDRLWSYYRNPLRPAADVGRAAAGPHAIGGIPGLAGHTPSRLAQAAGLPSRLTSPDAEANPREIVIENDIAWRIDTLVDFLFGRPVRITSTARDEALRRDIDAALDRLWSISGGITLMQDMALLGCVHGSADLAVRWTPGEDPRIEVLEAPRVVPILDPSDYRRIIAIIIVAPRVENRVEPAGVFERAWRRVRFGADADRAPTTRAVRQVIEILSPSHRQVYDDGVLIVNDRNPLGELPVVHVQNASQPYRYEGLSDVEPLVPLQDELNTRLSDRAHRVTLQSFNMYLARGIEMGQGRAPLRVAPGQVWWTDNPDADIKSFGGDGHSPSEDRHIDEIREALDKTSGVSPVVIGVVRERLGQLSSENALRVTLTGILSKTARKRITYGRGIEEASRLVLAALDIEGVLTTRHEDRGVRIEWSDPLPADERNRLAAAQMKRDLGVPTERILRELGYEPTPTNAGAHGAD